MNTEAEKIRAGINQDELLATAAAAGVANRLIEQRTFSWTEFFNRIEETLPADVMVTAVQPSFDQENPVVLITVVGRNRRHRRVHRQARGTGGFRDVLPTQVDTTDEGLHRLMVRSTYTGTVSEAPEGPALDLSAEAGISEARIREAGINEAESAKPPAGAPPPPAASPQPAPSPGTTPAPSSPRGRVGRAVSDPPRGEDGAGVVPGDGAGWGDAAGGGGAPAGGFADSGFVDSGFADSGFADSGFGA